MFNYLTPACLLSQLLAELEDVRKVKEHAVVDRERQAAAHAKALSEEVVAARILATYVDNVFSGIYRLSSLSNGAMQ